jgi:ABC-type lipoprotein export system ATPase subunit
MDLPNDISHKMSNPSGGERQRLLWARNVFRCMKRKDELQFIILDEPDNNLDRELFHKILEKIIKIHFKDKPIPIILSTHKDIAEFANKKEVHILF